MPAMGTCTSAGTASPAGSKQDPPEPPALQDSWPVADKLKYACRASDDNGGFILPRNGTVDPQPSEDRQRN
jgi:hypothetical protein